MARYRILLNQENFDCLDDHGGVIFKTKDGSVEVTIELGGLSSDEPTLIEELGE